MSDAASLPQGLRPKGPKAFQLTILFFALIGIANANILDIFKSNAPVARDESAIKAISDEPSVPTGSNGKHIETFLDEVTSTVTVLWSSSPASSTDEASVDSAAVNTRKHTETILEEVTSVVTVLWPASSVSDTESDNASEGSVTGSNSAGKNTQTVWDEVTSTVVIEWSPSPAPDAESDNASFGSATGTSSAGKNTQIVWDEVTSTVTVEWSPSPAPDVSSDGTSLDISATATASVKKPEDSTAVTDTLSTIIDTSTALPPSDESAHATASTSFLSHSTAAQESPVSGVPIPDTSVGIETSLTQGLSSAASTLKGRTTQAQSTAEDPISVSKPTISSAQGQPTPDQPTPDQSVTEAPVASEPVTSAPVSSSEPALTHSTAEDTTVVSELTVSSGQTTSIQPVSEETPVTAGPVVSSSGSQSTLPESSVSPVDSQLPSSTTPGESTTSASTAIAASSAPIQPVPSIIDSDVVSEQTSSTISDFQPAPSDAPQTTIASEALDEPELPSAAPSAAPSNAASVIVSVSEVFVIPAESSALISPPIIAPSPPVEVPSVAISGVTPSAQPSSGPEESGQSLSDDFLITAAPVVTSTEASSTQANEPGETPSEDEDDEEENNDDEGEDNDQDTGSDKGSDDKGGKNDDDDDDDGGGGLIFGFPLIKIPGLPLPKPPFPFPGLPGFPPIPIGGAPPPPPGDKGDSEDGEDDDDDDEETTIRSCTASTTLTAHCGQRCVISPITTADSTTYTTVCATASCTPTVVCDEEIPTSTITTYSTETAEPTPICEPESCLACGKDGFGSSHEHPPDSDDGFDNEDDLEMDDPPAFDNAKNRLRLRQMENMRSILQPEITSPETWEDGPEVWWGQMLAMVENKGARSRHETVRLANGLRENRGLSSMDFSRFGSRGDAGGAGPIWGCTVVVIATDKGIWTSHHWEEPNFVLRENLHKWPQTTSDREFRRQVLDFLANGELRRRGSSQKLYRGINDLRRYLVDNNEFLYVRIITPSRVEMGDAWFPERVWSLGTHLADLLGVTTDQVTTFTYEKGIHPRDHQMPHGMVTWQYAPATPVEWGEDDWINSRVLRVRFQNEILFSHVWCPPNTNPALDQGLLGLAIKGRQPTVASTGISISIPVPTNAITVPKPLSCPFEADVICTPEFCGCDDMKSTFLDGPPRNVSSIQARQIDPNNPSIFQNEFTQPISWPAERGGRDGWWRQMRRAISECASQLRQITWRREDGSPGGRGYSSSEFFDFGENGGGGGTGPMWGCTAVVIATNFGIYTAHFWEEPNFQNTVNREAWPEGMTAESAFQAYVLDWILNGEDIEETDDLPGGHFSGINDLRDELINFRNWIDVTIITPHSSRSGPWRMDSGIPYYGRAVQALRAHICEALNIHPRTVRIVTYPKGRRNWATTPPRWQGMVSWHYAPRTPVRPPGTNQYFPARGLRLRWGNEIIMERSWCIPGTEDQLQQPGPVQPSGSGLAARAERTSGTMEATRTLAEWETGTAVPTDVIDIDGDFVCEMPRKPTSTRTWTATTEASTGSEDATSGATGTIRETGTITEASNMLETSSMLETGSFLETTSILESMEATSSEVDQITSISPTSVSQTTIWFSTRDWDQITHATVDSSTTPTSISRTTIWFSTRDWDEITHTHFDTTSPSTSTTPEPQVPSPTTAQPAPENTDTVKYHFTQLLISPHNIKMNPTYVEIQAFQRGRSMFEDEEDNDIEAGTWSFDDANGWDGKKITRELENYGTQTRAIPGAFSISLELVPIESIDDVKPRNIQIKYLWLNQEWDTTGCDFKLNTGNPTSGFEYSRRSCTFDVRLWGKNGLCTLHPDHKDCEGISE